MWGHRSPVPVRRGRDMTVQRPPRRGTVARPVPTHEVVRRLNKLMLPGLACAVVLLAGCGGSPSPSAGGSASASAAAPSTSVAAEPSTQSSPTADSSPGGDTQEAADPCSVLSAAQVSDLTGVAVKKGTSSAVTGSKLCTWLPKDGTKSDAALFTAQEGAAQGGSLADAEDPLKKQFGGKVTKTTVPGAEDARYITGKASGANIIDVLALRGDVFYQVLAASPRDVGSHKAGVYKMAEALLKG